MIHKWEVVSSAMSTESNQFRYLLDLLHDKEIEETRKEAKTGSASRCSLFDLFGVFGPKSTNSELQNFQEFRNSPNSSFWANSPNIEQSEQKFWKIPSRANTYCSDFGGPRSQKSTKLLPGSISRDHSTLQMDNDYEDAYSSQGSTHPDPGRPDHSSRQ